MADRAGATAFTADSNTRGYPDRNFATMRGAFFLDIGYRQVVCTCQVKRYT